MHRTLCNEVLVTPTDAAGTVTGGCVYGDDNVLHERDIFVVRCNGSGHEYISQIMRYSKHVPRNSRSRSSSLEHHECYSSEGSSCGKYFNIPVPRTWLQGKCLFTSDVGSSWGILMKLQIIFCCAREHGPGTFYY